MEGVDDDDDEEEKRDDKLGDIGSERHSVGNLNVIAKSQKTKVKRGKFFTSDSITAAKKKMQQNSIHIQNDFRTSNIERDDSETKKFDVKKISSG